jgi:putative endopeptidase
MSGMDGLKMGIKKYLKTTKKITASIIVGMILLTGCSNKTQETNVETNTSESSTDVASEDVEESKKPEEEARIQDDFDQAINGEWLATATIPEDDISIGSMNQAAEKVEKILMDDFDKFLIEDNAEDTPFNQMLNLYKIALDFEQREEDGVQPLINELKEIESIESLEDYNEKSLKIATRYYEASIVVPMVRADMMDAKTNALYLNPAISLSLGDKSYYEESNPASAQILPILEQTYKDLLLQIGKTEEEAAQIAKEALEFEKLVASYKKSAEEASVVTDSYNPVSISELAEYSENVDLVKLATDAAGADIEQVILVDVNFTKSLDQMVNQENFSKFKNWMIIKTCESATGYLTNEYYTKGAALSLMMAGMAEEPDSKERAFYKVTQLFAHVAGDYYGKAYFGEEAKADVTNMVEEIIGVYKERLAANDWLSDATKAEAVKKLETMQIRVGYPETFDEVYHQFKIKSSEEGGTFFENAQELNEIAMIDNFAKCGKEASKNEWPLSAKDVNAMYNFTDNSINFPAAILQGEFYDINKSKSENYGAIGTVIGHEITHAFDNNGSQYDENGNIRNWWTEEDAAKFKEKTDKVIALYDGIEYAGGKVNGTLTVTENVADLGGLSASLEVLKKSPDADLEAFFTSYGTMWRSKMTPEYESMLLTVDVHAPNKLRINIPIANFKEFYETFDVKESDGMYIPEEKRVNIW